MQAMLDDPETARHFREPLRAGYRFLVENQIKEELPDAVAQYRAPILGGWCFSDAKHRWPVSDCTAEALTAILLAHKVPGLLDATEKIPLARIADAAEFVLSRQNQDGGFGTYERRRGSLLLEKINPSEMFGNCMTELSYAECTGSSMRALAHFRQAYSGRCSQRLDRAIDRGIRFLRSRQNADGSFAGFWGINFTYAAFFVIEGLRAAGVSPTDPALRRAAAWLLSKQRSDGGWAEHYSGCLTNTYVEHSKSQVVMTSWALLALMETEDAISSAVHRGIDWLRRIQDANAGWPRQAVNGVFFGSAMLHYQLYESYFPAWALARYARLTREH
jgi:lanosterol synthase